MSVTRGLSADYLTELRAAKSRSGHLFEAHFDLADGGPVYCTDLFVNVSWNGNLYVAVGGLLGYDNLVEDLEGSVARTRVSLNGVDQEWIGKIMNLNYWGRPAAIYKAQFKPDWTVVVDPTQGFDGVMVNAHGEEDDEAEDNSHIIVIEGTNDPRPMGQKSGRRTNHQNQQLYAPGDGFFKHVTNVTQQLSWGAKL